MNRNSAASIHSPRLSGLLQQVDVVQAAEQISQLATDIGCAFDCVRLVVGELSTVIETHESVYTRLSHLCPEVCRACSVSDLADCCTSSTCYIACRCSLMRSSQSPYSDCKPKFYRSGSDITVMQALAPVYTTSEAGAGFANISSSGS